MDDSQYALSKTTVFLVAILIAAAYSKLYESQQKEGFRYDRKKLKRKRCGETVLETEKIGKPNFFLD